VFGAAVLLSVRSHILSFPDKCSSEKNENHFTHEPLESKTKE